VSYVSFGKVNKERNIERKKEKIKSRKIKIHRCTQRGGGRGGLRSKKLSHKNTITHEKRESPPPPRFSDNPKYPPKKNLPKPQGPRWISNDCASMPKSKPYIF
jgi:hypothetical protein